MRTSLTTLLVLACLSGGLAQAQSARKAARKDLAPTQGSPAPDFDLFQLQPDGSLGKTKVKLSSFKGKRPVALVFGSYT